MKFTSLELKNWRNFQRVHRLELRDRIFIIGPNASGKSNLLDAFRFLRDVAIFGLAKAVADRDGISAIRCLNARGDNQILIAVEADVADDKWKYELVFSQDNNQRPIVRSEKVTRSGKALTLQNAAEDLQLQQYTSLEQPVANREFRALADFFKSVKYENVVPQLVRDPRGFSPLPVKDDPFGRDFLVRVWQTPKRTQESRLEKICQALQAAVPQFKSIAVKVDELGAPHLAVSYEHWRAIDAKQSERDLSDGTIRLIGFLWSLFEGDGPVLLEEPEGSLHKEVVRRLMTLVERVNRSRRTRRQIIISTHSEDLLFDRSIAAEEVLRLDPTANGTEIRLALEVDKQRIKAGLSVAEVLLPQTSPKNVNQLALAL